MNKHRWWVAAALTVAALAVVLADDRPVEATSSASFSPMSPTRVLDTRSGLGGSQLAPGGVATVSLLDVVPRTATAAALNVTVTEPTATTFITVWPSGTPRPNTSNLNAVAGQTRPNAVVVKLGVGRAVSLFNAAGSAHLLVDVLGWFSDGFTGISPARAHDTRLTPTGPLASGARLDVVVAGRFGVPADATAVALNVTVTEPTSPGFVTVWPQGARRPETSNLNFVAGETVPNMVTVGVGSQGGVSLFNSSGRSHVIVDVFGWFSPTSGFEPYESPERVLDTRTQQCGVRLGPGETRTVQVSSSPHMGAVAMNVTAVGNTATTYLTVWPAGAPRPTSSNVNAVAGQAPTPNMVISGVGPAGEIAIFNAAGTVEVIVDVFGEFTGVTPSGTASGCPSVGQGGGHLVAGSSLTTFVGTDLIGIFLCRVPTNSQNPAYGDAAGRYSVSLDDVAAAANAVVGEHFRTISNGKYNPQFRVGGYIDLHIDEGPDDCVDKALDRAVWPLTNAVISDNARGLGDFARVSFGRRDHPLREAPRDSHRHIGVSVLPDYPHPGLEWVAVAHELGHTLYWPHSFIGPNEYDNFTDLMSHGLMCESFFAQCSDRISPTLGFNELAAGWLSDDQVYVHTGGSVDITLAEVGASGVQLALASDPDEPLVSLTIEAFPEVPQYPVIVHLVDQRGTACAEVRVELCYALYRRQWQAFDRGDDLFLQNVLAVGESVDVAGVTVSVMSVAGGRYRVRLSGALQAELVTPPSVGSSQR